MKAYVFVPLRATKTKLEMVWTQVERNSLLIVVGDGSGNLTSLDRHCFIIHSHVVISVPIKIGAAYFLKRHLKLELKKLCTPHKAAKLGWRLY